MIFFKVANHFLAATCIVAICIDVPVLADDAPPPQGKDLHPIHDSLQQAVAELQSPGQSNIQGKVEVLDTLASRCSMLAGKLPDGPERLEAQNGILQIRYIQAEHARRQDKERDAAFRVGQLRAAAWQLKQHPGNPAAQVADRWLLLADLFDINRTAMARNHRQRGTIQRLEQFLATHRTSPVTKYDQQTLTTRNIEQALLRLYDQRGMCAKVGQLIEHMKTDEPDNHDLHSQLHWHYAYLPQIGRKLNVKIKSSDGAEWPLDQSRKGVLLIVFWSPTDIANAQDLLGELQTDRQDVSVLNILVGDLAANTDFTTWPEPLCTDQEAVEKLAHLLSVRSVPRVAIIDHDGQVAAVGGPAIHDRLDKIIELAYMAQNGEDTHEAEMPQEETDLADEPAQADEPAKTGN